MVRVRRRGIKNRREYPDRPIVGVGGVLIAGDTALLIRRGHEPLKDQWSIPGGALELGETIRDGLAREMLEETGLEVRVSELIEVFERVIRDDAIGPKPTSSKKSARRKVSSSSSSSKSAVDRPRYHFVILDYLCEPVGGSLRAGGDVTDARFVRERDLPEYGLTETALRVLRTAFEMARGRAQ